MFDVEVYMQGLDELYKEERIDKVEHYLLKGIDTAQEEKNDGGILVMLNALMGYYRAVSRHEDMIQAADRALSLVEKLGIQNTIHHGTCLLNIATGYRAAGKLEEAEKCYRTAEKIYEKELKHPDDRMATLHNNLALLYAAQGRLAEAKKRTRKALAIVQEMPGMDVEEAITYTNLGNTCFGLNQVEEACENMEKAVQLFEKAGGHTDTHYPAALAGLGQAHFQRGELTSAKEYYEKALHFIEKTYGKNDDWHITSENLEMVKDLLRRREAVQGENGRGLELSREYYEEVGKSMILEKYPEYSSRIAAGLAGEGSECMGFDDVFSTDHDFGPGFCLWLTEEDYEAIGEDLQKDYEALPGEWHGYPVRNTTEEGNGRVGVGSIDGFFQQFTGYKKAPEVRRMEDVGLWLSIPSHGLQKATNGAIFQDELGEFTARRKEFEKYPLPVKLYRLSDALHRGAQAGQYNFIRGRKRKDRGMMYNSLAEFVTAVTEVGYLLNDSYMPFYKWRFRGMETFKDAKELKTMLTELIQEPLDSEKIPQQIETICGYLVAELRAQGLSEKDDSFLDVQHMELQKRLQECFQEDAFEKLVDKVVLTEWEQFQQVHNQGGRASCQNNWTTFEIMRKSQFLTWKEETLRSYLGDLLEGNSIGWNLITEKYGRMMEHTSPEEYRKIAKNFSPISPERERIQETLISIMMGWTSEVYQRYPHISKVGRTQFSGGDTQQSTSSETYLRGELSTYSDATLKLYGQMVADALKKGENLVENILTNTVHFYGYPSLQEADTASE